MMLVEEYAEKAWKIFKETWPRVEHSDVLELAVKQMSMHRFALRNLSKICTCDRPPYIDEHGTAHGIGPHTAFCVRTIALTALDRRPF